MKIFAWFCLVPVFEFFCLFVTGFEVLLVCNQYETCISLSGCSSLAVDDSEMIEDADEWVSVGDGITV